MRSWFAALAGALILLAVGAGGASAQSPYSYPWCAYYAPAGSGLTSCYFASYEQCMASVSGVGGFCGQNPAYRGPDVPPGARAQSGRQRRHHH